MENHHDSKDSFDEIRPFIASFDQDSSKTRRRQSLRTALRTSLALLGLLAYSILLLGIFSRYFGATDSTCARHVSTWSPALEVVQYERKTFEAAFHQDSPYKGASPEVDAAWNNITRVDGFYVPEDQLVNRLHKPTTATKTEEGYLVWLEVFHQLHCVNMLRKYTYMDYYHDKEGVGLADDGVLRAHLDHCLDLLRIVLMCHADTTLMTFNWIKGIDIPSPDFNNVHMCRNFDSIWGWAKDEASKFSSVISKTPDVVELPEVP